MNDSHQPPLGRAQAIASEAVVSAATQAQPMVDPKGIRNGDPLVLGLLVERRGGRVLAYAEEVTPPNSALQATSTAFLTFRAAVSQPGTEHDPRFDPESALLHATRSAAGLYAENPYRPVGRARPVERTSACELMPQLLVAWLEATLTDGDEWRLVRHLQRCPDCSALRDAFARAERRYRHGPPAVLANTEASVVAAAMARSNMSSDPVGIQPQPPAIDLGATRTGSLLSDSGASALDSARFRSETPPLDRGALAQPSAISASRPPAVEPTSAAAPSVPSELEPSTDALPVQPPVPTHEDASATDITQQPQLSAPSPESPIPTRNPPEPTATWTEVVLGSADPLGPESMGYLVPMPGTSRPVPKASRNAPAPPLELSRGDLEPEHPQPEVQEASDAVQHEPSEEVLATHDPTPADEVPSPPEVLPVPEAEAVAESYEIVIEPTLEEEGDPTEILDASPAPDAGSQDIVWHTITISPEDDEDVAPAKPEPAEQPSPADSELADQTRLHEFEQPQIEPEPVTSSPPQPPSLTRGEAKESSSPMSVPIPNATLAPQDVSDISIEVQPVNNDDGLDPDSKAFSRVLRGPGNALSTEVKPTTIDAGLVAVQPLSRSVVLSQLAVPGAALVVILIIVVLATGVLGGGGDDDQKTPTTPGLVAPGSPSDVPSSVK